ncbi:MAG: DUF2827 family protein [Cycloclasticus sp.]
MSKNSYTIAISVRDDIDENTLFHNGVSQNIFFLSDLFKLLGHKVFLHVNTDRKKKKLTLINNKSYPLITDSDLNDKSNKFDIAIEAGQILSIAQREAFVSRGAKIISLHCGNQLIMDMETIFYTDGSSTGIRHIPDYIDDVWVLPHHAHQKTYMEVLMDARVSICPYIWEPYFLPKNHKNSLSFRDKPNIYVMEPNISVLKNALIPISIIELLHRKNIDIYDKAYIINGMKMYDHPFFLTNITKNFGAVNNKISPDKLYFTPRATFVDAFTHYDVLLSHHWNNDLNNLSFEAIYSNIPFVHNSQTMKDIGYYYPDFDVKLGSEALETALTNIKIDFEKNKKNNQQFLKGFSIQNKEIQNKYSELISSALSS